MLPYMEIGIPHWSGNATTGQGNTVYFDQISELF